ncbi:hypothetical protein QE390_003085 [Siphonobacter sp. SORGH_AS 1065]|nr:hypothetical protein [Siphonobacter sp. SORGH_AS_1065]
MSSIGLDGHRLDSFSFGFHLGKLNLVFRQSSTSWFFISRVGPTLLLKDVFINLRPFILCNRKRPTFAGRFRLQSIVLFIIAEQAHPFEQIRHRQRQCVSCSPHPASDPSDPYFPRLLSKNTSAPARKVRCDQVHRSG